VTIESAAQRNTELISGVGLFSSTKHFLDGDAARGAT
jgi:hypothetical protein